MPQGEGILASNTVTLTDQYIRQIKLSSICFTLRTFVVFLVSYRLIRRFGSTRILLWCTKRYVAYGTNELNEGRSQYTVACDMLRWTAELSLEWVIHSHENYS